MMKKIAIILLVVISSVRAWGQTDVFENIVDSIERVFSTQTINFDKESFAILGHLDISLRDEMAKMEDDIEHMKVTINGSDDREKFCSRWAESLEENGYEKLSTARYDKMHDVTLFVLSRFFTVTEAHFIAPYENGLVVSFFGKFRHRDLRRIMRSANTIKKDTGNK